MIPWIVYSWRTSKRAVMKFLASMACIAIAEMENWHKSLAKKKHRSAQWRLAVRQSAAMWQRKRAVNHWWLAFWWRAYRASHSYRDARCNIVFAAGRPPDAPSRQAWRGRKSHSDVIRSSCITYAARKSPCPDYAVEIHCHEFVNGNKFGVREKRVIVEHAKSSKIAVCNPLTIFAQEKRTSSMPIFVLVSRALRPSSDYNSIPIAILACVPRNAVNTYQKERKKKEKRETSTSCSSCSLVSSR